LKAVVGPREIDALVVTIGGNDVGFSGKLTDFVTDSIRFWKNEGDEKIVSNFQRELNEKLRDSGFPKFKEHLASMGIAAKNVFITEYPPTLFDSFKVEENGTTVQIHTPGCGVFDSGLFLNVSLDESELITKLGTMLNKTLKDAATQHGWHFISGVAEGFRGHGYCSPISFFRSAEESCQMQGDFDGMMHPNERGIRMYGTEIAKAIKPYLPKPYPPDAVKKW
jgi:hypothetical protein